MPVPAKTIVIAGHPRTPFAEDPLLPGLAAIARFDKIVSPLEFPLIVIAGLDPAIHGADCAMDARVKPYEIHTSLPISQP